MTEEINKKIALKKNFPLLLMLSLIGLGSLLLGLGASYWLGPQEPAATKTSATTIYSEFLTASWNNPQGTTVDTASMQGKTLVINFWASWCPPCVEEMPMLSALNQRLDANSVQMLGIGIDSPSNLREFLEKTQVSYPILTGGMSGSDWMKRLGNNQGALPFTVILSSDGTTLFTKLGKISESEILSTLDNVKK